MGHLLTAAHKISYLMFQRIRYWCMMGTPFLSFYAVGITLQTYLPYMVKVAIIVIGYIGIFLAGRYVFDDRLMNVLPMAVYLATKVMKFLLIVRSKSFSYLKIIGEHRKPKCN